ncbi:unnamed protein product, partial [Brassica napus]
GFETQWTSGVDGGGEGRSERRNWFDTFAVDSHETAVDNGWGGRDSHLKAERTVSNVLDYFIRLKDPTMGFDGLADILENGLNELNTLADDGSLEEVTETLLDLYYECLEGNYQRVEQLRVTSSQTSAKVVKVCNCIFSDILF